MGESNLTIKYKKTGTIDRTRSGYTDIDLVSKRHLAQSSNLRKTRGNITPAVKDFEYFFKNECATFFNKLDSKMSLLDVGCGNGEYYFFIKRVLVNKKVDYNGCEISDSMVAVCKKNIPRARFYKSYADNISANDNKYDVVFCSGTLQYTIDRWRQSLVEMKRVANKYICLLRLPVAKFAASTYIQQDVISKDYLEKNYFILLNRKELEQMFESIKLKVVKRDYSLEDYVIEGVEEKIVLVQYLLEKKK